MKKVIIIDGPNLNLVGRREPDIYGTISIKDYLNNLTLTLPENIELEYFQSNHEGEIIDILHEVGFENYKIILNAGAYTHTSIAIRDAIAAIESPVIELHISDVENREDFRKLSYLSDVCVHQISGLGLKGYKNAIEWFANQEKCSLP